MWSFLLCKVHKEKWRELTNSRTICILSIIVDSFAEACMKKSESVGVSDEFTVCRGYLRGGSPI